MIAIKLKKGIEESLQCEEFPSEEKIQGQLVGLRKFYT
jgi:hypothetical protein